MRSLNFHLKKRKGFTLVELMVSIVISSIIMLGVVSLYSSSRKGQKINDSLARIQENLRFAAEMMARDIRMAGYSGCRGYTLTNALNSSTDLYYINKAVLGYEGGVSTFPSEFQTVGTTAGDRVAGTDAIAISRVASKGFKVTDHQANSATISVDSAAAGIEKDDILAISDCNHTAIFQVSGPAAPTNTVVHNTGASTTPGNCWKNLGYNNPVPACGAANGASYTFDRNARLYKYILHGYFVGISASGTTKSLYIINMDKGVTTATELVEGVEDFQIVYGVDTDADGFPNAFVKASDAAMDFSQVVTVNFGMRLTSIDSVKTNTTIPKAYTLADTTVTPVTADADRKLHFTYNTTIKIRNKGIR